MGSLLSARGSRAGARGHTGRAQPAKGARKVQRGAGEGRGREAGPARRQQPAPVTTLARPRPQQKTLRPLPPPPQPRVAGGPATPPHPPEVGGGTGRDNVTWSPGVRRSCQPPSSWLESSTGCIGTHHWERATKTHSRENAQLQAARLGPRVCVLLIPLQSLKAEARESNPNRSRNSGGGGSRTGLLCRSRESAPRAHIQRSQVRGGRRGGGEGARPARSPGGSGGARGGPAGSDQGLNLVRPGDLAGLESSSPGAAAAVHGAKNQAAAAATGQRRPCAEGGRREREEEGVRRQPRKRLPGGCLRLPTAGAARSAAPWADLTGPGPAAAWHRDAPGVAIGRGCRPPGCGKPRLKLQRGTRGLAPLRPASPACSRLK